MPRKLVNTRASYMSARRLAKKKAEEAGDDVDAAVAAAAAKWKADRGVTTPATKPRGRKAGRKPAAKPKKAKSAARVAAGVAAAATRKRNDDCARRKLRKELVKSGELEEGARLTKAVIADNDEWAARLAELREDCGGDANEARAAQRWAEKLVESGKLNRKAGTKQYTKNAFMLYRDEQYDDAYAALDDEYADLEEGNKKIGGKTQAQRAASDIGAAWRALGASGQAPYRKRADDLADTADAYDGSELREKWQRVDVGKLIDNLRGAQAEDAEAAHALVLQHRKFKRDKAKRSENRAGSGRSAYNQFVSDFFAEAKSEGLKVDMKAAAAAWNARKAGSGSGGASAGSADMRRRGRREAARRGRRAGQRRQQRGGGSSPLENARQALAQYYASKAERSGRRSEQRGGGGSYTLW